MLFLQRQPAKSDIFNFCECRRVMGGGLHAQPMPEAGAE
jgi:hypothetical protein